MASAPTGIRKRVGSIYQEGERVKSAMFGKGTVEEIDGMAVVILFDSGQRKKLNAEYARLEKLS